MPVPKNGRSTKDRGAPTGQELPEGAVFFDSDTELSEEQLEVLRARAESAQKDAQIATLTAQLLTTRNELIKAKKTIEKLVEERDGKNAKAKRGNKNQVGASAQDGRRVAGKESKPSGTRAKRQGGSKPR